MTLRAAVLQLLHECNEQEDHDFFFQSIRTHENEVRATVLVHGRPFAKDYMDPSRAVRRFCEALATDLRAAAGRSVYFTLEAGHLRVAA